MCSIFDKKATFSAVRVRNNEMHASFVQIYEVCSQPSNIFRREAVRMILGKNTSFGDSVRRIEINKIATLCFLESCFEITI